MKDYNIIIDKYYPVGSRRRDIYIRHCRQVADLALNISHKLNLPLNDNEVETAAMLHDIGIFQTDAPGIDCHGQEHYLCHGILGAKLLRNEGYPEEIARVAERHTGAGITSEEISSNNLPLPHKDFLPETLLERLICYADKFYSKSGEMRQKSLDEVIAAMQKFGKDSVKRFELLHQEFNISDNNIKPVK